MKKQNYSLFLIMSLFSIFPITTKAASFSYLGYIAERVFDDSLPYRDFSSSYLVNPNLKQFKQYAWTTWKDSVGGRMAHDPAWFKMPNEKYLTKEIPIQYSKLNILAEDKNELYFRHLCQTEAVSYISKEHPFTAEVQRTNKIITSTWFYPRYKAFPVKNMDTLLGRYNPFSEKNMQRAAYGGSHNNIYEAQQEIEYRKIMKIANQNPFINPDFGYYLWDEGTVVHWDFKTVQPSFFTDDNKSNRIPEGIDKNTFREYMNEKGDIYRFTYSATENKFLPSLKVNKPEAQYYQIYREIERKDMNNLGIWGKETIDVEYSTGKILSYRKTFSTSYFNLTRGEDIPINTKRSKQCEIKTQEIDSVLN